MGDDRRDNLDLLGRLPNLNSSVLEIKAYKRRWIIISIFAYYAAINSFQWIEYSIITNVVMKYYNVSAVTVEWTSIIYMALYAPLVFPASYLLDKKGLRTAALVGGLGTALGTAIKVFSIQQDLFWVVLLGQSILAASQLLILCLPPRVAAVWFKANEVSTACSLGVFGTQLGCALGFVLGPILVRNHENIQDIGADLKIMCWGLTIVMLPGVLGVLFYFPLHPPNPPNAAQLLERSQENRFTMDSFIESLKVLMRNKAFVTHVIAYGINVGVFSAIGTVLNQLILYYFPNAEEDAGRMGLVMVLTGMAGSVVFGIFLDRTHKYKETTFFIYLLSLVSVIAFTVALEMQSKLLVYISISAVGLFTNAYMPVGFEMAMELTFPSSEGTTTGLLMAPSQIMGVIFALLFATMVSAIGPFWAMGSQILFLLIGTIITAFVPNTLRRQEALQAKRNNNSVNEEEVKIMPEIIR